jgi:hypothetical protein
MSGGNIRDGYVGATDNGAGGIAHYPHNATRSNSGLGN